MKIKHICGCIGIILFAISVPAYIKKSAAFQSNSSIVILGLHVITTLIFIAFPFVNKRHISINRMLLLSLALISIDFGVAGIIEKQAQPESIDYFDVCYQTLALFSFSSEPAMEKVPLLLNVARYTAVTTTITLLLVIFASQMTHWLRARLYANHAIICGLGEAGSRMTKSFLKQGIPVVAIELEAKNHEVESAKAMGAVVFQGNAYDEVLLRDAGLERSRYVIAVTGDDELNIDITSKIAKLKHKSLLVCYAHVQDAAKKRLYRQHEIFNDITDKFDARIFNLFDMSARQILHCFPPDQDAEDQGRDLCHQAVSVMLAGDGPLARALACQIALTGHYESLKKPRVYFDPAVNNPIHDERSTLEQILDIETIPIEKAGESQLEICRLIICFDNEVEGFEYLTRVLQLGLDRHFPILFCAPHNAGLISLFRGSNFFREFPAITFFDVLENVFQHHVLIDSKNDDLAKRIHAYYLSIYPASPNNRTWEQLTEDIRDSNRLAADHMAIKERATGRLRKKNPSVGDEKLFGILAQMEHNRWYSEKMLAGYVRDARAVPRSKTEQEVRKLHPLLLSWEELDTDNRQANVERIKLLYRAMQTGHSA